MSMIWRSHVGQHWTPLDKPNRSRTRRLARFADALVRSLDTAELSRALHVAIGLLIDQSTQAPALAARVENHLRAITESEAPLPAFEN